MNNQQKALCMHIGQSDFYYHISCIETAQQRNVNHLSPERLGEIRQAYTEVDIDDVPVGSVCSMLGCWQPLHRQNGPNCG